MIKDADLWRAELRRTADQLERRQAQRHWTHVSFTRTEQAIMLAFYAIRKILEAGKTSPAVRKLRVRLTEYNRSAFSTQVKVVAPILQAYYALERPHRGTRDVLFVCHQIVHSYVFAVATGYESGFAGVYFASDRERNERLFFLEAEELVATLRRVGADCTDFFGWAEERLPDHRIQTAFPPPRR